MSMLEEMGVGEEGEHEIAHAVVELIVGGERRVAGYVDDLVGIQDRVAGTRGGLR